MKQLSKTEKASIMDCAPAYFEYLLAQGADTCLAKILGVFQARSRSGQVTLCQSSTSRYRAAQHLGTQVLG